MSLKSDPLELLTPPNLSTKVFHTQSTQVRSFASLNTSNSLKSTCLHSYHSSQIVWNSSHLQTSQPSLSTLNAHKSKLFQSPNLSNKRLNPQRSQVSTLCIKQTCKQKEKTQRDTYNNRICPRTPPKRRLLKIHSKTSKQSNL